ncbi:DinB family protein [Pontibacter ummariensis]|uniref:DinB superfamily protein n=1 Tax=Pontibacter ummariensis TaxID=1610492 RepID=A0A239LB51_9BACT|nr:DinB family protein [Pontibacter ummariensis]PRY03941.1 DinB family protein [Pontibacter ummariensis]SNT27520.1 DinB superfamily protein [Pontibacter ummariensis]
MKAVNQGQLLEKLEAEVERQLQETIKVFQNLTEEELLKPAANGGWSIAQCLAHLNSYGDYYLPRIKAGLESQRDVSTAETYKSSWLGVLFTRMMDPATGKKKYKSIKEHTPPTELDAYAVVGEFVRQQEALLAYLRLCQKTDLGSIQIPISVLKWLHLNLGDILQFLVAHNQRHMCQARKSVFASAGQ